MCSLAPDELRVTSETIGPMSSSGSLPPSPSGRVGRPGVEDVTVRTPCPEEGRRVV